MNKLSNLKGLRNRCSLLSKIPIIMRITVILLFAVLFQVHAESAHSQEAKISLKLHNSTIEKVLQAIESSSDYYFLYSNRLINVDKKVNVDVDNESISAILDQLFSSDEVGYEVKGSQIIITPKESNKSISESTSQQQVKKINGTVVDIHGETIIGANVIEKGSGSNGTITDFDGNFTLEVNDNTVLVISYIGYLDQEVSIKGKSSIEVILKEDNQLLDEVVVVGYGSSRKSDLTGGIVSVDSEKLKTITSNNLLDKLVGQVPGLKITTTNARPGEEQSIRVRGENSLSANNSPLIVLDGIPYSGSISDIDPDIVENLSVLKDASSAAIYGSRGSNGVILIQTKKGREGSPTVTYKGQVGMEQVQKRLNVMNGAEYVKLKQDYYGLKFGYTGDDLDPMKLLNPTERLNYQNGTETDWQDIMFRDALTHSNQVSISGGTEATKYMAAISHLSQDGVMKNTGMKRTNMSVNVTQDLSTWLTIGMGTQVVQRNVDNNQPYLESGLKLSPYGQFKTEDGRYVDYPMDETLFYNPMANIDAISDKVYRNVFISTFANVKLPVKGLSYRTNLGYNYRSQFEGTYYGRNTLSGRPENGSANVKNNHYNDYTWENLINYSEVFGKHKVEATGLFSVQETQRKTSEQSATSFVNDDSEYHNMNAGEKNQKTISGLTETSTMSYMFRVNYGYDNRYLATLTGRSDGYSAFGANNKYAFFPSAALAWNISSESFMEKATDEWLDMLKLRLSYGSNGNQAINPYQTLDRLSISKYIWGDGGITANGSYLPSNGVGNPNLRWETSRTLNFGIDFSIFNRRLAGNIEIYETNTSDLLMSRNVPIMNGYSSIMDNVGKTRNRGIEIGLNSINIENKDFVWTTNVNFALNRDKIVELRGDGKDDITNKWFIGQPLRVFYDYNVVGTWQSDDPRWNEAAGKYLNSEGKEIQSGAKPGYAMLEDTDGNGSISSKDMKVIGSKLPSFLLSMGNQFSYKNLSLSFLLDGVFGVTKERKDLDLERWGMDYNYLAGMNYWTPDNPTNYMTSLLYVPYDKHTFYDKINYVQVKNITLGYNLDREFIKPLGLTAMNINVSVNNLCSFSNIKNATNLDADNMYSSYPTNRSYMFGLNLTF